MKNLIKAAKAIIAERDHYAETGAYQNGKQAPGGFPDGCFDDWAADILEQALRADGVE